MKIQLVPEKNWESIITYQNININLTKLNFLRPNKKSLNEILMLHCVTKNVTPKNAIKILLIKLIFLTKKIANI